MGRYCLSWVDTAAPKNTLVEIARPAGSPLKAHVERRPLCAMRNNRWNYHAWALEVLHCRMSGASARDERQRTKEPVRRRVWRGARASQRAS